MGLWAAALFARTGSSTFGMVKAGSDPNRTLP
jgi:hypothetical protein